MRRHGYASGPAFKALVGSAWPRARPCRTLRGMSHPSERANPRTSAARARAKAGSSLRVVMAFAVIGAFVGALVARSGNLSDLGSLRSLALFSPMGACLLTWLVLSVYWEISARSASAARASESPGSRRVHVIMISAAQLLVFWPYPGWLSPDWSRNFSFPVILPFPGVLVPLGLFLAVAGLAFAIVARRHLGRNWSGEVTLKVDHELVRSGPYRWLRHPIYTGALAMYLGPALVSGRVNGAISVALALLAYARKIPQEERVLEAEFGEQYADYRRRSWAIVPGLW